MIDCDFDTFCKLVLSHRTIVWNVSNWVVYYSIER